MHWELTLHVQNTILSVLSVYNVYNAHAKYPSEFIYCLRAQCHFECTSRLRRLQCTCTVSRFTPHVQGVVHVGIGPVIDFPVYTACELCSARCTCSVYWEPGAHVSALTLHPAIARMSALRVYTARSQYPCEYVYSVYRACTAHEQSILKTRCNGECVYISRCTCTFHLQYELPTNSGLVSALISCTARAQYTSA